MPMSKKKKTKTSRVQGPAFRQRSSRRRSVRNATRSKLGVSLDRTRPDAERSVRGMTAVVALTDARSFWAAAEQLGVTPSGMSRMISRVEEDLGARLVERTTRRMRFTELG